MSSLAGFKLDWWTIYGLTAQFLFFFSFVVQWYKSEKAKTSIIPMEFWILRTVATLMLLFYIYQRRDAVFLVSSILQLIIYFRNMWLLKSQHAQKKH